MTFSVPESAHLVSLPHLTQQSLHPRTVSPKSPYKLTDVTVQSHLKSWKAAWMLSFRRRKQVNRG